jgi:hypothetical protein
MKYGKILLVIASGTMMLAHGARMIYEGISGKNVYRPDTFDIFFDWTTLAIAGLIMFSWGLYLFYSRYQRDHEVEWEITCPNCGFIYKDNIVQKVTTCPNCHVTGEIDLTGFDIDYAKDVTHPPTIAET